VGFHIAIYRERKPGIFEHAELRKKIVVDCGHFIALLLGRLSFRLETVSARHRFKKKQTSDFMSFSALHIDMNASFPSGRDAGISVCRMDLIDGISKGLQISLLIIVIILSLLIG
jgi:hypothetical protein